ncbi:MAG: hypothetical protein NT069_19370 [Planctomycetota bacterium]|nr:hypothetical protein [Planctomycetota bacterium]
MLFLLALAVGSGWLAWGILYDNRMYRRLIARNSESERHLAYVTSRGVPDRVRIWLQDHNLVLFPQIVGRTSIGEDIVGRTPIGEDTDPELLNWIVRLPGCSDVSLSGSSITDENLRLLSENSRLHRLWLILSESDMSGRARPLRELNFGPLRRAKSLQALSISRVRISEREIAQLAQLDALTHLRLYHVGITEGAIQRIHLLKHLMALHLDPLDASVRTVDNLKMLPDTVEIHLTCVSPNDETLVHLASVKQLVSLAIEDGPATDVGIEAFARHGQLERLRLERLNGITDTCCESLGSIPNLKFLLIDNAPIGDSGLDSLARATGLKVLTLRHTRITEQAVKRCRDKNPKLGIDWW